MFDVTTTMPPAASSTGPSARGAEWKKAPDLHSCDPSGTANTIHKRCWHFASRRDIKNFVKNARHGRFGAVRQGPANSDASNEYENQCRQKRRELHEMVKQFTVSYKQMIKDVQKIENELSASLRELNQNIATKITGIDGNYLQSVASRIEHVQELKKMKSCNDSVVSSFIKEIKTRLNISTTAPPVTSPSFLSWLARN